MHTFYLVAFHNSHRLSSLFTFPFHYCPMLRKLKIFEPTGFSAWFSLLLLLHCWFHLLYSSAPKISPIFYFCLNFSFCLYIVSLIHWVVYLCSLKVSFLKKELFELFVRQFTDHWRIVFLILHVPWSQSCCWLAFGAVVTSSTPALGKEYLMPTPVSPLGILKHSHTFAVDVPVSNFLFPLWQMGGGILRFYAFSESQSWAMF